MGMEPYYDYGASDTIGAAPNGVAGFLMVFMLIYYLLIAGYAILNYVLYSLSTYSIAKRRGIHNPWLAWLPFGSEWILGSISDQYQYLTKGRVRNRRKVLLGLSLGMFALLFLIFVGLFVMILSEAFGTDASEVLFGGMLALVLLGYVAILILAVILLVFQYIALYDLYVSCEPGNGVLYLVLSILFAVTLPFFVFACRKKDLGMPPRKQPQPVVCIQEVAPETAEEVVDAPADTVEE